MEKLTRMTEEIKTELSELRYWTREEMEENKKQRNWKNALEMKMLLEDRKLRKGMTQMQFLIHRFESVYGSQDGVGYQNRRRERYWQNLAQNFQKDKNDFDPIEERKSPKRDADKQQTLAETRGRRTTYWNNK